MEQFPPSRLGFMCAVNSEMIDTTLSNNISVRNLKFADSCVLNALILPLDQISYRVVDVD